MKHSFFLFLLVVFAASLMAGCAEFAAPETEPQTVPSQTSTRAPEVKPVPVAPQPTLEALRQSQQQLFNSCWGQKEWPTDQATQAGCALYAARQNVELAQREGSDEQLEAALKSLVEAEAEYDRLRETCWQASLACFMEKELACGEFRRLVQGGVCPSSE